MSFLPERHMWSLAVFPQGKQLERLQDWKQPRAQPSKAAGYLPPPVEVCFHQRGSCRKDQKPSSVWYMHPHGPRS